jgi:P4 family phage/plasmid primase-like protien
VRTGTLVPTTPLWFSLSRIAADYAPALDPDGPEIADSRWMRLLHDQWAGDPRAILMAQEWFGYVLSGRTDLQKAMLVLGLTGSGKGVIADVLKALVSYVSTSLHRLNTNFGLAKLYQSGATLAVMGDVRFNARDASQATENLLGIIGQDTSSIDIKYKDEVDADLRVRFHMSANEIPNIPDNAAAMARRLLILVTRHQFGDIDGMDDPSLRQAIIDDELALVLRWALAGLERLDRQGHFTRARCHDEMIGVLKGMMSPVLLFVGEHVTIAADDDQFVGQDTLYRAWSIWAGSNGHNQGTKVRFIYKLTTLPDYPMLRAGQKGDGTRVVYGIAGVRTSLGLP